MKQQVKLTERQLSKIIKESMDSILNQSQANRANLLKFAKELSIMRRKCYDLACNFEGIDQEMRQGLISIGHDISSLRYKLFNSNNGLTRWDDEEYKYEPMFDED